MAQGGGAVGLGGMVVRGGAIAPTAPAVTLLFLNLVDGLFTLAFLQLGIAEEANPIMRLAYEASPLGFMAVKLGLVNAGVLVLALHGAARLARVALKAATFLYAVIVVWHCAFLLHLISR
jgi:hypothetical protein